LDKKPSSEYIISLLFEYQRKQYFGSVNPVSLVTRLRAERQEFNSRKVQGFFLFATASIPALEPTQLPTQWALGNLSSRVKRPGS